MEVEYLSMKSDHLWKSLMPRFVFLLSKSTEKTKRFLKDRHERGKVVLTPEQCQDTDCVPSLRRVISECRARN